MKKFVVFFLGVLLLSCNTDEDPAASDQAELLDFSLEASSGFVPRKVVIDVEIGEIIGFNNSEFSESDFPVSLTPNIAVSPGATINPASGTPVSFSDPEAFVKYTITSEDGSAYKEYLFTIRDRQLTNPGFENWFNETGMNGKPFAEPGKYAETTMWATANMGTSMSSVYGTSPETEGSNTMAKIETLTTAVLPLIAGALYVGKFDLDGALEDPTNPVASAILGTPFADKPSAVSFSYAYTPGEQMIQATLKDPGNLFGGFDVEDIDGTDKFGFEATLEKRVGDEVILIAQAKHQSDETVESMTEITIPLQYFSNEEPKHFYVSFSPSFYGGEFKGAIGSTLIIDDVKLIYE